MSAIFIKAQKANLIGFLLVIPISLIIIIPFWMRWAELSVISIKRIKVLLSLFDNAIIDTLITVISPVFIIFIGIVIHELIHGFFMFLFTKKINTIKFGFRKDVFVPYAHCKVPLISSQMLIVSLAPWFILGLIPYCISLITGNLIFWFIGFSMTLAAAGDFLYAFLIFKTGLNKKIKDHDSEIGFVIIEE